MPNEKFWAEADEAASPKRRAAAAAKSVRNMGVLASGRNWICGLFFYRPSGFCDNSGRAASIWNNMESVSIRAPLGN
jgi:hypothetical protein